MTSNDSKYYANMQEAQLFFRNCVTACMEGRVDDLEELISNHQKDYSSHQFSIEDVISDFQSEKKNLIHIAAGSGHSSIMNFIIKIVDEIVFKRLVNTKDMKGFTPLIYATIAESEDIMRTLLSLGADVNASNEDGATSIHFAAADNSLPRLKLLYDSGADTTLSSKAGNALHWAASKGCFDTVSFLLKEGADANALNANGLPAVIMAAVASSCSTVCLLLKAGANLGYILSGNLTLLHICAEQGMLDAVLLILASEEGRKCCNIVTDEGNLPINLAAMSGHRNVVESLYGSTFDGKSFSESDIDSIMQDGKARMTRWETYEPPVEKNVKPKSIDRVLEPTDITPSKYEFKEAEVLKSEGNKLFLEKKFSGALGKYSAAIRLNGTSAVMWSNRSACYLALGDAQNALVDAEVCRRLDPHWAKGCYRLAAARLELHQYEDAAVAAFEGCKIDDNNAELKKLLKKAVKLGQEEHKRNSASS